jgi:hypothetical protein
MGIVMIAISQVPEANAASTISNLNALCGEATEKRKEDPMRSSIIVLVSVLLALVACAGPQEFTNGEEAGASATAAGGSEETATGGSSEAGEGPVQTGGASQAGQAGDSSVATGGTSTDECVPGEQDVAFVGGFVCVRVCGDDRTWGTQICEPAGTGGSSGGAVDADCDGFPAGVDCDDHNNTRYPGACEICGNNLDDDCDGLVDEDCGTGGSPATGGAPSTGGTVATGGTVSTGGTVATGGFGGYDPSVTQRYEMAWAVSDQAMPYLQNVYFRASFDDIGWVTLCGTQGNYLEEVVADGNVQRCGFYGSPGQWTCLNAAAAFSNTEQVDGIFEHTANAFREDWSCPTCCEGCGKTHPVDSYVPTWDFWFMGFQIARDSQWEGAYTLVPSTETVNGVEESFVIMRIEIAGLDSAVDVRWNRQASGENVCIVLP